MDVTNSTQTLMTQEPQNDVHNGAQSAATRRFWNTVLSRESDATTGADSGGQLYRRGNMDIRILCRSPTTYTPVHSPPPATAHSVYLGKEMQRGSRRSPKWVRSKKNTTCSECGQNFKRSYDLNQHINAVHLKRKSFACIKCSKRFAHKGTLSKHEKTVHLGLKPFSCAHCGHRFSEKGNVNKHMQRTAKCRMALERVKAQQ